MHGGEGRGSGGGKEFSGCSWWTAHAAGKILRLRAGPPPQYCLIMIQTRLLHWRLGKICFDPVRLTQIEIKTAFATCYQEDKVVTTAVAICSINKKRLHLHLRITHHQLLFTSADILSLTSEGCRESHCFNWHPGTTWLGPHESRFIFFPKFYFFMDWNSYFPPFMVLHRGSRLQVVFVRICTFLTDILWTEFVNKNMSFDTQKFLETAQIFTVLFVNSVDIFWGHFDVLPVLGMFVKWRTVGPTH